MNVALFLKAGFLGFALSLGVLMLVFYVVGWFVRISQDNFTKVFILAAIAAFLATDVLLYFKIRVEGVPDAQFYLAGCVGGWFGGILSGLTTMKPLLLTLRK